MTIMNDLHKSPTFHVTKPEMSLLFKLNTFLGRESNPVFLKPLWGKELSINLQLEVWYHLSPVLAIVHPALSL
jgi:hypothetical protein